MREKINDDIMNIEYVFINKSIIDDFIKILCFDKFVTFRDVFEMKIIS